MKTKIIFIFNLMLFALMQTTLAQKKVLIEQFTNSGCQPCAGNTPIVAAYTNAHSDSVIMLSYHTAFPYVDSMYFENQVLSNSRVNYYSISGVPTGRIDGNYFAGNLVPVLSTQIPPRNATAPLYRISFNSNNLNNSVINSEITFESSSNSNQSQTLVAHIAVAEKSVLKSSYLASPGANSESEYPWVVRYFLPDENGTLLTNKLSGETDVISVSNILTNIKDISQVRIIAFVQNVNTKEVYQAEISTPVNTSSVNESGNKPAFNIILYPTNARDQLTFIIDKPLPNLKFTLTNILGTKLFTTSLTGSKIEVSTSEFSSGIYFANIFDGINSETKRFIITK